MKTILLGIYLICIVAFSSLAEKKEDVLKVLKKTNKTYEKIKTISGDLDILLGSPAPETDMLIAHDIGSFQFKKMKADTSLGWYLVTEFKDKDIQQNNGYELYYSGDSAFWFSLNDSTVEKSSIDDISSDCGWGIFIDWRQRVDLYYKVGSKN